MTKQDLEVLIERARRIQMSPRDREEQRRSFAYGNANIENAAVTREIVEHVANALEATKSSKK